MRIKIDLYDYKKTNWCNITYRKADYHLADHNESEIQQISHYT